MHVLLRCNINAGVHAHAQSRRVNQWCHNSPDGKQGYRERVTSRTGKVRWILGILKNSVELRTRHRTRRVDFRGSQTNLRATGAARDGGGGRWKSQNRKNVYLFPYVEQPLNSKVIKSFVPEIRNRKCFSRFEIPVFYIYIYIYMNIICPFRISVSGYGTPRAWAWSDLVGFDFMAYQPL